MSSRNLPSQPEPASAERDVAPSYLTTKQTAAYMGISRQRLEIWRCRGGGPPFIKVSGRLIRYRRVDVDAWLEQFRQGDALRVEP